MTFKDVGWGPIIFLIIVLALVWAWQLDYTSNTTPNYDNCGDIGVSRVC